jgi:hypothetical protein
MYSTICVVIGGRRRPTDPHQDSNMPSIRARLHHVPTVRLYAPHCGLLRLFDEPRIVFEHAVNCFHDELRGVTASSRGDNL